MLVKPTHMSVVTCLFITSWDVAFTYKNMFCKAKFAFFTQSTIIIPELYNQTAPKQLIFGSLSTTAVMLTVGIASVSWLLPHLTIVLLAASLMVTSLCPQ